MWTVLAVVSNVNLMHIGDGGKVARGSNSANAAVNTAAGNADTLNTRASGVFADLAPTLESTIANPQGFNPVDEAAMETGALQSAGGGQAAAVGAGNLLGARTGNKGAAAAAIPAASRGAGEQLSQNLLGIRGANAKLKEQQRSGALSGLENLYAGNVSGGNAALGEVAPLVQANTNAAAADPWNVYLTSLAKSVNQP